MLLHSNFYLSLLNAAGSLYFGTRRLRLRSIRIVWRNGLATSYAAPHIPRAYQSRSFSLFIRNAKSRMRNQGRNHQLGANDSPSARGFNPAGDWA